MFREWLSHWIIVFYASNTYMVNYLILILTSSVISSLAYIIFKITVVDTRSD